MYKKKYGTYENAVKTLINNVELDERACRCAHSFHSADELDYQIARTREELQGLYGFLNDQDRELSKQVSDLKKEIAYTNAEKIMIEKQYSSTPLESKAIRDYLKEQLDKANERLLYLWKEKDALWNEISDIYLATTDIFLNR